MIISITQELIDNCTPKSAWNCPLAIAFSKALGEQVACFYSCIHLTISNVYIKLPEELKKWINKYDWGETKPQPIDIELVNNQIRIVK